MSHVAQAGPYEVRPTRKTRRSATAIVGWSAFCALNVLARHGEARIITAAAAVSGMLVTLGLVYRWRYRSKLTLQGDVLTYTGLIRRRVVARRPISGRAIVANVAWGASGNSQRWLLLDPSGRAAIALDLAAWNLDHLQALCDRLGVSQEVDPTPRRPADLRRMYPGGIPWAIAYPYRFTFLLIGALSIAAVLLGAL